MSATITRKSRTHITELANAVQAGLISYDEAYRELRKIGTTHETRVRVYTLFDRAFPAVRR